MSNEAKVSKWLRDNTDLSWSGAKTEAKRGNGLGAHL